MGGNRCLGVEEFSFRGHNTLFDGIPGSPIPRPVLAAALTGPRGQVIPIRDLKSKRRPWDLGKPIRKAIGKYPEPTPNRMKTWLLPAPRNESGFDKILPWLIQGEEYLVYSPEGDELDGWDPLQQPQGEFTAEWMHPG